MPRQRGHREGAGRRERRNRCGGLSSWMAGRRSTSLYDMLGCPSGTVGIGNILPIFGTPVRSGREAQGGGGECGLRGRRGRPLASATDSSEVPPWPTSGSRPSPSPSNGRRSVCPHRPMAHRRRRGRRHDARNTSAFDELGFRPVAGQPAERQMDTTIKGQPSSMPVMIRPPVPRPSIPTARSAARAAANRGIPMGLSSFAPMPIEDVIEVNGQTFFQIYWAGDKDSMVARMEREGRRRRRHDPHPRLVVQPRPRLGQPLIPSRSRSRNSASPGGDPQAEVCGPGSSPGASRNSACRTS